MPALYAHNKFGKIVLKTLPHHLISLIKKYPNSFRIGLQGPDTLFFFSPLINNNITDLGRKIHKSDAYSFFEKALTIISEHGYDSPSHAYLLGFICHYVLDKQCHPCVSQFMSDTGCSHSEIEGDFEHYLMSIEGKTPHKYPLYKLVPTDLNTVLSLATFYPEVSSQHLHKSLRHMKLTKRLLYAPNITSQTVVNSLMHTTLHYNSFKGHMITIKPNRKCRSCMGELYMQLMNAVPLCKDMIEEFESSLLLNIPLSHNFHGNFY